MKKLIQPLNDSGVCHRLATLILWIWSVFLLAAWAATGALHIQEPYLTETKGTVFLLGVLILPWSYVFASRAYERRCAEADFELLAMTLIVDAWRYKEERKNDI